jgi:hypothetical protein
LSPEQLSIAAAEHALVDAFEARTEALADPSNAELRAELEKYWTQSAIPTLFAQLDQFVRDSKVLVLNENPEAFLDVLDGSERITPDRVDVPFCRLNSNIIVVQLAGIEAVLNDVTTTEWWTAVVLSVGGTWKVAGVDLLSDADGEVECDEFL